MAAVSLLTVMPAISSVPLLVASMSPAVAPLALVIPEPFRIRIPVSVLVEARLASIVPLLITVRVLLPISPDPSITSALVRVSLVPSINASPPPVAVASDIVPPPLNVVAPVRTKVPLASLPPFTWSVPLSVIVPRMSVVELLSVVV